MQLWQQAACFFNRKKRISSQISVFYKNCHKYLKSAKNIIVLGLKGNKFLKFLTTSVIQYYVALNQM